MEFPMILYAAMRLLTGTLLIRVIRGNHIVFENSYRQRTCVDNSTRYITHGSRVGVYTARTLIDCVAKCQREELCNYAVFEKVSNEKRGLCHMIFSIFKNMNGSSTLLSDEILSSRNKSHCLVASQLTKPMWDVITSSNIKKLELLPIHTPLKVTRHDRYSIDDISEIKITEDRIAVSRLGHTIAVLSDSRRQKLPITVKVCRYWSTPEVLIKIWDYIKFDGSVKSSKLHELDPSDQDIMAKTTYESVDGIPNVIIASTIDDVIHCLLRGFRRLVKHPSTARINMRTKQVEFDMNGVVRATFELQENAPVPIYYVKDKVSDNFGKRYLIPFIYCSRTSLSVNVLPTSLPWIFDNNWEEVLSNDDGSFNGALEKVVLQGRQVRVLVEGELSADLTTIVIISKSDIIATLPEETIPANREEPGASVETLRSQFTAISANRLRLVCSYLVHDSTLIGTERTRLSPNSIQWFVSKQLWEKMLVLDKDNNVVFGNVQDLIANAGNGKSIRVCIVQTNDAVLCFTTTSVTIPVPAMDTILVQSLPFYDPEVMYHDLQNSSNHDFLPNNACREIHLSVTSAGLVVKQQVRFGVIAQPKNVLVSFHRIDWFVEKP